MSGSYFMSRGWLEDPDFRRGAYTQQEAWCSLIEAAAWKDRPYQIGDDVIVLKRSELITTERQLAAKWKWSRKRVRGFFQVLLKVQKVDRKKTHGMTHLTICNYDKYQNIGPSKGPEKGPKTEPAGAQPGPTTEEGKESQESPAPKAPSDVEQKRQLYARGDELFGKGKGGGFVTNLLKAKDGSVPAARAALEQASMAHSPRAYIGRIVAGDSADGGMNPRDRMPSPAGG